MKKIKQFRALLLGAVAALAALLTTSCSDSGLLDQIPADADFVATIDFNRLAEGLDIKITADDIVGPADMKIEFQSIPVDVREAVSNLYGAIDASCVACFGNFSLNASEPQVYFVARLTDPDRLAANTDQLRHTKADGFDIYSDSSTHLLVKGKLVWLVASSSSAESAAKEIGRIMDHARDKNITKLSGVADRLSGDRVVNAVVNLDPMIDFVSTNAYRMMDADRAMIVASMLPLLKGNRAELTMDLADDEFVATASIFNPETGNVIEVPGIKEIDSDMLKYLPATTVFACALGVENSTVKQLTQGLQAFTGQNRALKPIVSALSKLDGTIVFGFGCQSIANLVNNPAADNSDLFIAAQFEQGGADELKAGLVEMLRGVGGLTVADNGNFATLSAAGRKFNLSARNDCLFITSRPELRADANIFASDMSDYPLAAEFFLPSLADLTSGQCRMQMKAMVTYLEGISRFSVKFSNLQGSLLSELIRAVNGLEATFSKGRSSSFADDFEDLEFDPGEPVFPDYSDYDNILND